MRSTRILFPLTAAMVVLLAVLKPSPSFADTIAYYKFDDGTDGAIVATATATVGLSGTATGPSVTFSSNIPTTPSGNALSAFFSGASDQAIVFPFEFPMHIAGDITLEFYLNIDHSTHDGIFWTRPDSDDTNRFNIYTATGEVPTSFGFDYRTPNGTHHLIANPGAIELSLNTWTHIAITRSGTTYEWFKDGVFQDSNVDSSPDLPSAAGDWQLSGRNGFRFRGFIDDVRISDTVLLPSEFLNAVPTDSDGDGVDDDDDYCAGTVIPESMPTNSLGVNRFALLDGDNEFDTTSSIGNGPGRSYSTADTAGCSCTQIIEAQGLGLGHTYHGCSISAMDDWLMLVN
jgi:hypothetical protein